MSTNTEILAGLSADLRADIQDMIDAFFTSMSGNSSQMTSMIGYFINEEQWLAFDNRNKVVEIIANGFWVAVLKGEISDPRVVRRMIDGLALIATSIKVDAEADNWDKMAAYNSAISPSSVLLKESGITTETAPLIYLLWVNDALVNKGIHFTKKYRYEMLAQAPYHEPMFCMKLDKECDASGLKVLLEYTNDHDEYAEAAIEIFTHHD